MGNVCAWCEAELKSGPASKPLSATKDDSPVFCRACARDLAAQMGTSLHEYLDDLETPIILFDSQTRLVTANHVACKFIGKQERDVRGALGGDVFECAYAKLPEGCGKTIHCSGCAIRRSVEDTFRSGMSHSRVPATLNRTGVDDVDLAQLLISTELVGGVVLLKIDSVA